jgi:UDP-N-acetylglucosamine transferase subunit ALG13
MIFLTVGTLFPFDRLVQIVDSAVGRSLIEDEVFAQIGHNTFKPKNIKYIEVLDKDSFDEKVNKAAYLISHAGMGTITMALDYGKPLLVMPRLKRFKEHVNDHQIATARKFEQLGHILAVYEAEELPHKIKQLRTFVPRPRKNQAETVGARIAGFLDEVNCRKKQ